MPSHIGLELPFGPSAGLVKVTQEFGEGVRDPSDDHGKIDQTHPLDQYLNYAIDFGLASGTAVLGQGHGTVVASRMTVANGTEGPPDGVGNFITVAYDNGAGGVFYATYMHLDQGAVPTTVDLGQTFAHSGSTGTLDNHGVAHPHLHVTYGVSLVTYVSNGDLAAGDTKAQSTIVMANGSVAANPDGAPVFFTANVVTPANFVESHNGLLHDGDLVRSDNVAPSSEVAATVEAFDQSVAAHAAFNMNGWFFADDPNASDHVQDWVVFDANAASTSGHISVPGGWILQNGQWVAFAGGQVPAGQVILLTQDEMNHSQFISGTSGAHDPIYVATYDGHLFSNWSLFTVTSI